MSKIIDILEEKLNKGQNAMVMMVGDSITYGRYKCAINETYSAYIAKFLASRFPEAEVIRYDGKNAPGVPRIDGYETPTTVQEGNKGRLTVVGCGRGGNTVRMALNRSDDYTGSFITGEYPDVFFLMFGINDALKSDPSKFILPEKFYEDLKELHNLLRKTNPDAEIVYMTPTYGDEGDSKESCLDEYSDVVVKHAAETDSTLVDTHKLWMDHLIVGGENRGQGDWLDDDPWHFSPVGSYETAKFVFDELNK